MLIYCPECENACSEQADSCPKCGHPLRAPSSMVPPAGRNASPRSSLPVWRNKVAIESVCLVLALVTLLATSSPAVLTVSALLVLGLTIALGKQLADWWTDRGARRRYRLMQLADPYEGIAAVGERGTAVTPLRPAGKVRFGANLVDVVADGSYVEADETVQVVERSNNRIVVRKAPTA